MTTTPAPKPTPIRDDKDDVRELALLIRQGLKLIVAGIERKYGITDKERKAA